MKFITLTFLLLYLSLVRIGLIWQPRWDAIELKQSDYIKILQQLKVRFGRMIKSFSVVRIVKIFLSLTTEAQFYS